MRLLAFLALLLICAAAVWHFGFRVDEPPPFVAKTRAAIGEAGDVGLEKAADYWLAASRERRAANDARRSGIALALAIRVGRLEALRAGAGPVPAPLKRQFAGQFSEATLNDTRWMVAAPASKLGRVLARWPVEEGAVTLGNVIVFKTEAASQNTSLFAHELAHVDQYRALGIGEFARRYAADPEPIEAEARAKSREVMRSL